MRTTCRPLPHGEHSAAQGGAPGATASDSAALPEPQLLQTASSVRQVDHADESSSGLAANPGFPFPQVGPMMELTIAGVKGAMHNAKASCPTDRGT